SPRYPQVAEPPPPPMKLHSTCIGPSSEKSVWNEVRPGTASYGVELSKAIVCALSGAAAKAAARTRAENRELRTLTIQSAGKEGREISLAREQAGGVPLPEIRGKPVLARDPG